TVTSTVPAHRESATTTTVLLAPAEPPPLPTTTEPEPAPPVVPFADLAPTSEPTPAPQPVHPAPAPAPAPTVDPPAPSRVYYNSCAAARAAGAAPLYRGEPGYRSGLDRDGDGVACE
uniref:excalibur calcium-binding domain-containing protein n=1 Tax=Nocardia farcinica TaxID=37329 RepID=UPI0024546725